MINYKPTLKYIPITSRIIRTLKNNLIYFQSSNKQNLNLRYQPNLYDKQREDVHARKFRSNYTGKQKSISYYKYIQSTYQKQSKQLNISSIKIDKFQDPSTIHHVPKLAHGLQQILRTGFHHGNMGLQKIAQPEDVDMTRINPYKPPSQDSYLLDLAIKNNLRYIMSTSTISTVLSHFYYIFSRFRNPNLNLLTPDFDKQPNQYMISFRKPVTVFLRKKNDNIYALDSDNGIFHPQERILMDLGKIMESQLTMTQLDFKKKFIKTQMEQNPDYIKDHYRYMFVNNQLCLRSQIDCLSINPQTNKPFVFQIKTRAICPIRYDLSNYKNYLDYDIKNMFGGYQSYERQYYDLIRGGFIKYAFQIKIGDMDGAFIAYHNTKKIYGYQYVKRNQMYNRIFGNQFNSDIAFMVCTRMLINVLDIIKQQMKNQPHISLKVGFYANNIYDNLIVFVQLLQKQQVVYGDISPQIKDQYDYYTKVEPLTNKIYKYQFNYNIFVNGCQLTKPDYLIKKNDTIQVTYSYKKYDQISVLDYMCFLHQAYKFDNGLGDFAYSGVWARKKQ